MNTRKSTGSLEFDLINSTNPSVINGTTLSFKYYLRGWLLESKSSLS